MSETSLLRTWLILLRTPRLGPGALREQLAAHDGQLDAVLAALQQRLADLPADTRRWLQHPDPRRLDADLAWLAQPSHRLMLHTDEDFPPQLESIAQPPAALFVAGDASLLLHAQLAIVGARAATLSGCADARVFARDLGHAGFTITSGMAEGIDGAAHVAALEAGLPTVAVVGTGLDRVYPHKHQALARRLAAEGALVSEFPPGTPGRADHFPRRNRLIAGLSLGTLVIEAGLQSGSLITARLAAEQGREVFALPGSIHNPLAHGCHRLIRDGARLSKRLLKSWKRLLLLLSHRGVSWLAGCKALPSRPLKRRRPKPIHPAGLCSTRSATGRCRSTSWRNSPVKLSRTLHLCC